MYVRAKLGVDIYERASRNRAVVHDADTATVVHLADIDRTVCIHGVDEDNVSRCDADRANSRCCTSAISGSCGICDPLRTSITQSVWQIWLHAFDVPSASTPAVRVARRRCMSCVRCRDPCRRCLLCDRHRCCNRCRWDDERLCGCFERRVFVC